MAIRTADGKLQCEMSDSCRNAVTHIGSKGWAYCATCAADRQYWERCRRMRQWEIERLERGQVISYERMTRSAFAAKYPSEVAA